MHDAFQMHREYLHAVAHRMLGSVSEADDAVQETWLRLARAHTTGVRNVRALEGIEENIAFPLPRGLGLPA